jgi:hypothetical protein
MKEVDINCDIADFIKKTFLLRISSTDGRYIQLAQRHIIVIE